MGMRHRTAAIVVVVVGLLAALVVSAWVNPLYQGRALVTPGVVASDGPDSLQQQLALAQSITRSAAVHVDVVGHSALEFRARSRNARWAADLANAHAQAYVELRRRELATREPADSHRRRTPPSLARGPQVVSQAPREASPVRPWPSETWTLTAMVLIALMLAIPRR